MPPLPLPCPPSCAPQRRCLASVLYGERVHAAGRRLVGYIQARHPCAGGPVPAPLRHGIHRRGGALDDGLDPPVVQVAHPARCAGPCRLRPEGLAEKDALHLAAYVHAYAAAPIHATPAPRGLINMAAGAARPERPAVRRRLFPSPWPPRRLPPLLEAGPASLAGRNAADLCARRRVPRHSRALPDMLVPPAAVRVHVRRLRDAPYYRILAPL